MVYDRVYQPADIRARAQGAMAMRKRIHTWQQPRQLCAEEETVEALSTGGGRLGREFAASSASSV